jgi:hypothetical protein
MKEATGELNMTVVTVVAIAAVAAFFYAFVWPTIKNNINRNTNCAAAYDCSDDRTTCKYLDDKGTEQTVNCKGTNTDVSTAK